jgi:hypothetical protein
MHSTVAEHSEHLSEGHSLGSRPQGKIRELIVGATKVLYENFPTVLGILMKLINEALAVCGTDARKCANIQLRKRTVLMGQFIYQIGSYCDLDAFYGVHDQQTELTVKCVTPPDAIECSPRLKRVILSPEWIPVGGEAVIIDRSQKGYQAGLVNNQAAAKQKVGLLFEGQGGLCVLHANPIEKPATFELGLKPEAWRVC